jgi:hypothetical protein
METAQKEGWQVIQTPTKGMTNVTHLKVNTG